MQYRLKILIFWLRIKVNSRVYILTAQTLFIQKRMKMVLEGDAKKIRGACPRTP